MKAVQNSRQIRAKFAQNLTQKERHMEIMILLRFIEMKFAQILPA